MSLLHKIQKSLLWTMDKFKIRNFKIEKLKWPTYFFLKITHQSFPEYDIMKLQQCKKVLDYREEENLLLAKKRREFT